jgi:hypothetical protein
MGFEPTTPTLARLYFLPRLGCGRSRASQVVARKVRQRFPYLFDFLKAKLLSHFLYLADPPWLCQSLHSCQPLVLEIEYPFAVFGES